MKFRRAGYSVDPTSISRVEPFSSTVLCSERMSMEYWWLVAVCGLL